MLDNLIEPRLLKGFRDTLPDQMLRKRQMIAIIEEVLRSFGFQPLETPVLEYADILLGKLGDEGEKLLYKFRDHGDREVAMRYDFTVSLARVVAQYPDLPMPFKRYQVGPVWRADNTQRGRYREFYQFDMDIVGTDSTLADAEILVLIQEILLKLGIKDFIIRINDRQLVDAFAQNLKLSPQQTKGLFKVLDNLEKVEREKSIAALQDLGLGQLEIKEIEAGLMDQRLDLAGYAPRLQQTLERAALLGLQDKHVAFDTSIVRGLDYYSGVVFEVNLTHAKGFGSVLGGGRYDDLVSRFSKQAYPAVGGSIGVDRLLAALDELGLNTAVTAAPLVYITLFADSVAQAASLRLAFELRQQGVPTETAFEPTTLGRQLKVTNAKNIPYAIIIGPDELKEGQVTLKNMTTGVDQRLVAEDAVAQLKNLAA